MGSAAATTRLSSDSTFYEPNVIVAPKHEALWPAGPEVYGVSRTDMREGRLDWKFLRSDCFAEAGCYTLATVYKNQIA